MKTRLGLSLLLVIMVVLTACSSPAPAPQQSTQSPAQVQETVAPTTESYPGPAQVAAPPQNSSVLYPGPKDGEQVTWSQAYAMIMNGEVVKIAQSGELQVSLTLKDGRTLVTTEPGKDEVVSVVQRCGDICKDIQVVSE